MGTGCVLPWCCYDAKTQAHESAAWRQVRDEGDARELKLKGKNHILKTGHYRMKTQLQQDAEKREELQVGGGS